MAFLFLTKKSKAAAQSTAGMSHSIIITHPFLMMYNCKHTK